MITKKCQGCDIAAKINQAEKNKKEGKETNKKKNPNNKITFPKLLFPRGTTTCLFFPPENAFSEL